MSGRCTCYKNKETKKQTKSGKKKQKKNELPPHAYSDIAQSNYTKLPYND